MHEHICGQIVAQKTSGETVSLLSEETHPCIVSVSCAEDIRYSRRLCKMARSSVFSRGLGIAPSKDKNQDLPILRESFRAPSGPSECSHRTEYFDNLPPTQDLPPLLLLWASYPRLSYYLNPLGSARLPYAY